VGVLGGWDPGFAVGGLDEDVEHVLAVAGGGVGADGGEFLGAGESSQATGDLDTQFRHSDGPLGWVVVEADSRVGCVPLVVLPPVRRRPRGSRRLRSTSRRSSCAVPHLRDSKEDRLCRECLVVETSFE
jgi:hypothetical protein